MEDVWFGMTSYSPCVVTPYAALAVVERGMSGGLVADLKFGITSYSVLAVVERVISGGFVCKKP